MKVHVLEGVGFDSNQYLLEDYVGKNFVLVDTGSGIYVGETVKFIESHTKKLDAVILTHRHVDHVGGAKVITERFGCEAYISEDDAVPLMSGRDDTDLAAIVGLKMPKMKVRFLEYGSTLKWFPLKVIPSPGHTVGSIVLYEEASGTLFSGDTFFAYGGVGRWDLNTGNLEQLRQSVKMLNGFELRDLYPGHGPAAQGNAREHAVMACDALGSYEEF